MEASKKYKVVYKQEDPRSTNRYMFVGVYLGGALGDKEQFSLRPAAGTVGIPRDMIISFVRTDEDIKLPRKIGRA